MNNRLVLGCTLIMVVAITNTAIADTADILDGASQTPSTETPISLTLELQTRAKRWSLDQGEYQRYLDLMQGPLGKWNPDLDPLLALGMFVESPQLERHYAELYAQQEFDLTERALQFQQAYWAAFERLYPSNAMLDQRLLAPYFTHQQQKASMRDAKRLARQGFTEGDRLLLFVPSNCPQCLSLINRLRSLLSSTPRSGVDVYVKSAQDDAAVRAWAQAHNIQPAWLDKQRLTLNRDEGLLQRLASQSSNSSTSEAPIFLKRNERFFQLSRETLGL
jgi:integrating conjugative element protein (TIGR03759 family)